MMGFKAAYLQFPEQRFSVITTCNLGSINPMLLAQQVADVYLGDQLARAVPSSTTMRRSNSSTASEPFDNDEIVGLVGTFYSDELDVSYELAVENGQLWLRLRNTPPLLLRKLEDGQARAGPLNLTFEHDAAEMASAFTVNAGRVTNIRFKRR